MNDRREFAELITGIAEVYGKPMSKAGMRLWWSALERFSDDEVNQALNDHVQDAERGQFMPKPSDIVRKIEGTPGDAANAAWAKVEDALRRVGGGPSWVFDDPKIHRAIQQIGGVAALSNCPTERDLTFLREQFCKRYASPQNQGPYPARLQGWHQQGEPVLIGDPDRAKSVLSGGQSGHVPLTSARDVAAGLLEQMS